MHQALALTTVGAACAVLALSAATPAAADAATQTVAFTVASGTLSITPGTPATGTSSVLTGGATTATVSLGLTTIVDTRINSTGWAVSASTTDFLLSGTGSTIAKTLAKFAVPIAPTSVLGTPAVTFTSAGTPVATDSTGTVGNLVVAVAVGVNTGTFSPQLIALVPNGSGVGSYTSTVTQTVV